MLNKLGQGNRRRSHWSGKAGEPKARLRSELQGEEFGIGKSRLEKKLQREYHNVSAEGIS